MAAWDKDRITTGFPIKKPKKPKGVTMKFIAIIAAGLVFAGAATAGTIRLPGGTCTTIHKQRVCAIRSAPVTITPAACVAVINDAENIFSLDNQLIGQLTRVIQAVPQMLDDVAYGNVYDLQAQVAMLNDVQNQVASLIASLQTANAQFTNDSLACQG